MATEALTEEELAELDSLCGGNGTSSRHVTGITLSCMRSEYRDLMDEAEKGWNKHLPALTAALGHPPTETAHSVLYWLYRYSGLINPVSREDTRRLIAAAREANRLRERVAFVEKEWAFSDSVIDSLAETKDGYMEEVDRLRAVLAELVTLKDDKPADYEERKPRAWGAARKALGRGNL